ncbi:glycoside hydrolase family 35 protein [Plicaturopsis crispa FD-325 SS-3]|nr:glycoside hydrolase family 35 protein [Plicaturopsis crispa FD-325 SS-3]
MFLSILAKIALIFFSLTVYPIKALERRNSTGLTDAVTWDAHSISIFGQRTFLLSAEVHPWRLPNPNLWSDVFQKIKANGFNCVSFYVNWALHFPTPDAGGGAGDFAEGTQRDIQAFIDAAKDAGLWMIARSVPLTDAETTGGGFPGWVGNIAGGLRINNSNYTEAWTPFMNAIAKLVAKNQVTNGGPIVLVQVENEYSVGTGHGEYMQALIDTYRSNGVVIPTTFNDQHGGTTGNFSPDLPGTGRVNIYCGDSYPQGANSWAQVQSIYRSGHVAVAPNNPLCLAEFGGGFLVGWNGSTFGGTGYEKYTNQQTNAAYEDVFYKENYAQTATILNIYMLFGGTNWGQTAEPTVYTSYDYGAGINENRVATPKMNEMRLQGSFLRVSRDLYSADYVANGTNYTSSALIYTSESRNAVTGAGFYFVRHNDSTSTSLTTTTLKVTTTLGPLVIPQNGSLTFDGRDAKIIVTDYVFGRTATRILYSTAEIMTWTTIDDTDFLILYAPAGQTGETAIQFASQPTVDLSSASGASATFDNDTLLLNYPLSGSQFISITLANSSYVLLLLDKTTASQWSAPIISGDGDYGDFFSIGSNRTVLIGGPYLVRDASIQSDTLLATGDIDGTTAVEFFAPSVVSKFSWNGAAQTLTKTSRGSFTATLSATTGLTLPSLGPWKVSGSLPEIDTDFDDSNFVTANLTSTNYTNLPPLSGRDVLYSQQYGFYGGNLIWRGHFTASGQETAFNLSVQGGFAFGYSAFLNGVFLGSHPGSSTLSISTDIWSVPNNTLRVGGDNVLTVLQDHMGISETSTNSGKEPRGIRGYKIIGGNATFSSWKLQGNQGGAANAPDTLRGYLNEGGLYAERIGAHLPGYPDSSWATGDLVTQSAGVNFFRTSFTTDIPPGVDMPVRLAITPSPVASNFRVQIYLNGWQLGKYINNLGPQTIFVLPAGILLPNSTNTLGLSLWSLDSTGASIADISLVSDGTFTSALNIQGYEVAPDYAAQKTQRPAGQYIQPM